jgi:hypothetical protein
MSTAGTKSVYKNFNPWQIEEEQAWLEEMARQGWRLVRIGLLYHFVSAPPEEVVFRLDYVDLYSRKKLAAYRQLFLDSGWEFVCANWSSFQYFRIPVDQFNTDIYSDLPSRVEQLRRMRNSAFSLVAVWIALMVPMLDFDGGGAMNLLILGSYLAVAGFYLAWANKTTKKIKELENQLADDDPS